jgi:quercetin dioxygenase-like cupin family protein
MKVVKMDEIDKEELINPVFTGREVTRQALLPESKEYQVNIINFGKGVRNKFHAHDSEQILIIIAGKGIVATEKEEKVVTVGDIVLIAAGEKHWHGSGGDSDFSHIVIVKAEGKMKQLED